MNISELYPSMAGFVTTEVVEKKDFPAVLHITKCEIKQLGKDKNKPKLNVYFAEIKEKLRCNKANALEIAKLADSDNTDNWEGTTLSLEVQDYTSKKGENVTAIRVIEPVDEKPKGAKK